MTDQNSVTKTVAQVDVQSAWASKINWTQMVGAIAMLLAFMTGGKFSLTAEQQLAIVTVIGVLTQLVTFIQRTWYTTTITPSSAASPSVPTKEIVKMLLLGIVLSGLMFGTALAADVNSPAKTPSVSFLNGYPYQSSGFYFGAYTLGGGGSVQGTAPGVSSTSLTTTEIGVGGLIGYAWGSKSNTYFIATEAMFGWSNFNGSTAGFSFDGPLRFEQRVKFGTPLSNVLSLLPNLGLPSAPPFPALPNGQTITNTQAYFMVGLHEDDNSLAYGLSANREWGIAPSIGLGMMGQLSNGTAIDVWVETQFSDKTICVGPVACVQQGQKVLVGAAVSF